jgi:hypothetical protein
VKISADLVRTRHGGYGWLNAVIVGTLDPEPVIERAKPAEEQTDLMAVRADLFTAYAECRATGDEASCEQIADSVAELDDVRTRGYSLVIAAIQFVVVTEICSPDGKRRLHRSAGRACIFMISGTLGTRLLRKLTSAPRTSWRG